jgi:hypothetical protein
LTLTEQGRTLAAELIRLQTRRIEVALGEIETLNGTDAREHVRRFLFALIAAEERAAVTSLVAGAAGTDAVPKPEVRK